MPFSSRIRASLVLLATLAACDRAPELPTAASTPGNEAARLVLAGPNAIPGRYVVVFGDGQTGIAAAAAQELVSAHGGTLHHSYEHALRGFAAELSPQAVQALLADPRVAYVAQDGMAAPADTQFYPTWGLDRIDQRVSRNGAYIYSHTGDAVTAYVIDSGILTAHTDFGGRASVGADFVGDGRNGQDCSGHGTHVAGTIGGTTYGVAKQVELVAVRVFGCSGGAPFSTIIAAVDWVTANAQQPAVVTLSLSGELHQPLNQAVQASIAAGNTFAVAAGNGYGSACNVSPASTPEAITVAASTMNDERATFSNSGPCVDLYAPGSGITSAGHSSTTATTTLSGTSMAAAHVAGVAALYLEANPAAAPAAVASAIVRSATIDRINYWGGAPNRLLFSPLTIEPVVTNPRMMEFVVVRPAGSPPLTSTRPLVLTNAGATPLEWNVADSAAWLQASPAGGTLAPGDSVTVNVTVSTDTLPEGYSGRMLVFSGGGHIRSVLVSVHVVPGTTLSSGVPVPNLSAEHWSEDYFMISVPAGADSLVVASGGGSGDADLYVRRDTLPNVAKFNCQSYGWGSQERCTVAAPAAGDYYILVHAFGAYSGVTLQATVYGLPARPAAPGSVTLAPAGPLRVNVGWADVSDDETLFRVRRAQRGGDGTFGAYQTVGQRGPNNTSLVDSAGVLGATYRYQVQACNALGCTSSLPSSTITIVNAPAAPGALAGVVVPGGEVDLTWADNSSNETQFRVRRGTRNPDGTFTAYTTIRTLPGGTAAYADTSAVVGATYRYQVQACNGAGCANSNVVAVTVPALPAAPTGVSAQAISSSMVNLAWTDASSNESQFRIRRTTRNPDGSYAPYQSVGTRSWGVTSHTDQTATAGATHRYIIQACNASGCSNSTSVGVTVPAS